MEARSTLLVAGAFAVPTAILAGPCLPAAAAIAVLALAVALRWRNRPACGAALCAMPVLFAALPAGGAQAAGSGEPDWPRPGPVRLAGTVAETARLPAQNALLLRLLGPLGELRIVCDGAPSVLAGDRITAVGALAPGIAPGLPPSLHVPAGGLAVTPAPASLPRLLAAARARCEGALLALVPGEHGAVLATLVLGRGTRAPREVADAHRATGLSHLLAVSGAHAAMLGAMLGLGGAGFGFGGGPGAGRGRRLATRRWHVLAALLVLFFYAGITGGEPPVLRAVIMYALAALAIRTGRVLSLFAGLMVPALFTAMTAPTALLGPSFLLSYAAVCGLALAGVPTGGALRRWLLAPLRASFWATCTTAPITLWWFGQIAPWTILLTPLLGPLVALMLLLGLLAAVLALAAPALAAPFAPLLDALVGVYVDAVALADELPGTPIRALCSPGAAMLGLGVTAALVALALPARRRRLRTRVAAAVLALVLPWFVPPLPAARGAARVTLLAVGHGQAALLETATGELVGIDCGSLHAPTRAARQLVDACPIRRLDWLVLTHADHDHHNGTAALLQRAEVRRALLPRELADSEVAALLRTHGAELAFLAPGERLAPTPGIEVAAPVLATDGTTNDRSLWTTFAAGGTRVLFCGDAESEGIRAAIAQGVAAASAVLVLPHHGRDDPAVPELLAVVRPACCLASAASSDAATAAGEIARAFGAEVFVTGLDGDVEVELGEVARVRVEVGWRVLRSGQ